MAVIKNAPKRAYQKPEFRAYGDLRQLTQGNTAGGMTDAHPSGNKKT